MSIFKCKMCGGELQINPGESVAVCEYCGTTQTLPKLDDDRRVNLYDRANHFRRNNDFDKAAGIYEQILNEDKTDAEAYWSLVLCRYGIEYVEDPATHKRVPTVNRAQYTSIFDDEDYKAAIQYADAAQRVVYEAEAKAINEIQKGILEISQKEEPFDVFICYKETDANGRRTPDSVLATDLYHQLTQEGFKVFFSRITLEDKLGTAYEPYIFAALNSAKVMVVLGTKPEYFNAVWVKNEWSRYLALIRGGAKKVLIPAYRDMDPYDLPEEFSHLQAQDMSKLGFMQDLIRGIKKLTETDKPAAKETVVVQESAANTAPLLKRAFIFLEDGDWSSADEYCERVLDLDPENAQAYLGKLLAELRVRKQAQLADCDEPFDDRDNFRKVIRFGDKALCDTLEGYITQIEQRNEEARLSGLYTSAKQHMDAAHSEADYKRVAGEFAAISQYRDAGELRTNCLNRAEECRKDSIYKKAEELLARNSITDCKEAIRIFQSISGWRDANEQICICQKRIEEIKKKEEQMRLEAEHKAEERKIAANKARRKRKKVLAIAIPVACACIAFIIVLTTVIIPKQKYNKAMRLLDSGDYDSAYALLEEIGNDEAIASNKYDRAMKLIDSGSYDSAYALLEEIGNDEAIASNKYDRAMKLINSGDYDSAYILLEEIGNAETIASSKYDRAVALIESGDYESAYILLRGLDYKDSARKRESIRLQYEKILLDRAKVGDYVFFGTYEQDNDSSNGKEDIEWLVLAKNGNKTLVISKYALDWQQYNTSDTDVEWESCSLRKWLNGTFASSAFTSDEQRMIQNATVTADENPSYSTSPGDNTTDKVFLLSIEEAEKYFATDESRKCSPTAYAEAQGAATSSEATCYWWLRSPGGEQYNAAYVSTEGSVNYYGNIVYSVHYYIAVVAARPAMWIELIEG